MDGLPLPILGGSITLLPAAIDLIRDALQTVPETDEKTPWMTVQEAAEYLRWPKKRIYNLTNAGAIPYRKQGNRLLFHQGELDAWLDGFYEGPSARRSCGGSARGPTIPHDNQRPRRRANAPGRGTGNGGSDADEG